MRILYGVQATGNGHITRARTMAPELAQLGIQVDYVFTGRPADQLFDMAPFGTYQVRRGLSFCVENGRMNYLKTARQARLRQCIADIKALDTHAYDLVITDFEPITAWAARRQGTPCIGIGHQYAFAHAVPKAGANPLAEAILRWFAPAQLALGSHWHHFDAPILPPLIHTEATMGLDPGADPNQVLVYLPFENTEQTVRLLRTIEGYQFHLFCADKPPGQYGSVHVHPFGRESFQSRLRQCPSVICNAGFELVSEALHLGKRILVKPIAGQMEQASNALALKRLGLGA
ncbi:MAG: MJ1255/VC2487 family glycosyltransferase, partial [Natronospirillum sp.]